MQGRARSGGTCASARSSSPASGCSAGWLRPRFSRVLAVDLVTLTAGASLPEPPLAIAVDWRLVALACAVYGVLTAGLVALSTRRAV